MEFCISVKSHNIKANLRMAREQQTWHNQY